MRILVDTNVLLDYLLQREPYWSDARRIIALTQRGDISACIAAHSVSNIFYIIRKDFTISERRRILIDLCKLFTVEGIDSAILEKALKNEAFDDFEDCLQMEYAITFHSDFIISRNTKDYVNSSVPCIEPTEFLKLI